ncbi:MAG: hypothetical protein J6Y42_00525, partial [Bacilli bacterium]|nr:hypothetical protein [Bacilli bacterium]
VKNNDYKILRKEEFLKNEDFMNYISGLEIIDNDKIKINVLKLKDEMFSKVENIHALEPNYLRSDI